MISQPITPPLSLMAQEVDPHTSAASVEAPRRQTARQKPNSRRGKQYKCGNCQELGHNQKTCPRRAVTGAEATHIQPAMTVDAADIFTSNVAPPLPGPVPNSHIAIAVTRIQPCKLDAALEAANKRVMAADKQVANASSEQDFEEATNSLDSAVRLLEKVASCAQRCAIVAHSLGGGSWETPEREPKRMRIESPSTPHNLTPTTITLNDATAVAATEAVDAGEVVTDGKVETLE
eukprot:GFKZ01000290.1.p1 GENE.GFKZ01000290.1~~GFKZ01000290.1.p1  ORF type:complete len:234 (+),score=29.62 GFKZ01000290.1:308-1009(+)